MRFAKTLLLASALALCAASADAAIFNISLTGDVNDASLFDTTTPTLHNVGAFLNLTGLDANNAITVDVGDTINATVTLINGTLTLAQPGDFAVAYLHLTGGAAQDTEMTTDATFFLNGLQVAQSLGSIDGSNGNMPIGGYFSAPTPAFTFDTIVYSSLVTILGSPNASPPAPGVPQDADGGYLDLQSLTFIAAGGVPEPASWALMLVGFGGLGAALRRRRRPLAV